MGPGKLREQDPHPPNEGKARRVPGQTQLLGVGSRGETALSVWDFCPCGISGCGRAVLSHRELFHLLSKQKAAVEVGKEVLHLGEDAALSCSEKPCDNRGGSPCVL